MLRNPSTTDNDTWGRTSGWLILGFLCYALPWRVFAALPLPPEGQPALQIQGSNTIGARLGPALVKGLLEEQGFQEVRIEAAKVANEQRVSGINAAKQRVFIEVAAHGSGTAFVALKDASAQLGASSRPIKAAEAQSLSALGDFHSAAAEHIIAIDGLAVILNQQNPLSSLTTSQIAQVFSGEITTWEELGGSGGPIHLYARDDNSGTFDTFKELVLTANGKTLAASSRRFESSEQLSDAVSQDPQGIGFIGLPYIRQAKALAVTDGQSRPMLPTATLVATEDYPLSRRLFFYTPPSANNPWGQALVQFAHSDKGQALVEKAGFVPQTVSAVNVNASSSMPPIYRELAHQAQRLSVNFRFQQGSANLDNKALRDVERVLEYLEKQQKTQHKVVLVGFGDPKVDEAHALILSKWRAQVVRRELSKGQLIIDKIIGFGAELPVANNQGDEGRIKNRRVEVWVY
ncbi:MAG: phosphate ABC transporter substrate-binding/OmpA family protein [Pseudomonas sp.]|uniref:substrate-binding domain-containing protein n=1 Tax=Pseudomonas sp. TaxID=306 RepID=UPI003BB67D55